MDGIALTREMQAAPARRHGDRHERLRLARGGARGHEGRRLRLPAQALQARRRGALPAQGRGARAALRARTGGSAASCAAGSPPEALVGGSPAMQAVLRQVRKVAPQKTTVLIQGESGTGKELVARALHDLSPRAGLPFVAVNCGAIPGELLESELFGHARGAFTDAVRAKKGLAAEADGGTLFLDEVGELPLGAAGEAAALPPGGGGPAGGRHAGAAGWTCGWWRPPAGTCGPPSSGAVPRGPLLAAGGGGGDRCRRCASAPRTSRSWPSTSWRGFGALRPELRPWRSPPEAREALAAHRWPGNVRELKHAMERAVVLAEGPVIGEEDLPDGACRERPASPGRPAARRRPLGEARHPGRWRSGSSARRWRAPAGNRTRAAELLGTLLPGAALQDQGLRAELRGSPAAVPFDFAACAPLRQRMTRPPGSAGRRGGTAAVRPDRASAKAPGAARTHRPWTYNLISLRLDEMSLSHNADISWPRILAGVLGPGVAWPAHARSNAQAPHPDRGAARATTCSGSARSSC